MSPLTTSFTRTALAVLVGLGCLAGAQAQTMAPGVLKVGLEATYPPFESYDGDKIVGFDPDLTALLTREMKLKPALTDTKFVSLIPAWPRASTTPWSRACTSRPNAWPRPTPFPTPVRAR